MNYPEGTTFYPTSTCPTCGARNNAATHIRGEHGGPEDGDLSICFVCAAPMIFVSTPTGMGVRPPTESEKALIEADSDILQMRAMLTMFHGLGGSK